MKSMKKILKKAKDLHRLLVITTIFSVILLFTVTIGFHVSDVNGEQIPVEKTYQIIVIKPDETLWSIAKEYKNDEFYTMNEYINEVKSINSLSSDTIIAGKQLTIPVIVE